MCPRRFVRSTTSCYNVSTWPTDDEEPPFEDYTIPIERFSMALLPGSTVNSSCQPTTPPAMLDDTLMSEGIDIDRNTLSEENLRLGSSERQVTPGEISDLVVMWFNYYLQLCQIYLVVLI
jgi:hypothetical protein